MAKQPAIGVICAIPQELTLLRATLDHELRHEVGGFTFEQGRLDGHSVILAEAGIGKVNTATVGTILALRFDAAALVFKGVAGGLDPDLAIGDVVVADRAIQHDCGVVEDGRLQPYHPGHVPFFNPTDRFGYEVEPALLARVRARLEDSTLAPLSARAGGGGPAPKVVCGTVLAGDQFINCEVTRMRLHREFGGRAVAMEGAALAQVAERFGRPWLEIRALSDLAGKESHFDFGAFVDEAASNSATILRRILPVL